MKILSLRAENVKRLRAIEIEPDGSMVIVGGRNGAGKSSVLDSIAYALGGRALCPAEPIRRGETTARARVDLGDLVIERTWTEKGTYLSVKTAEGFAAPSPQAVLDKLVGRLSFDPLAFVAMPPREQVEALRELVGLDFGELDADRDQLYRDRTNTGRDVKRIEGQLASMPEDADAPAKLVAVRDLMEELREARDHNAELDRFERERAQHASTVDARNREIDEFDAKIKALHVAREAAWLDREDLELSIEGLDDQIEHFDAADTGAIEHQIADADNANERHRLAVARRTVSEQLAESRGAYQRATTAIEALDEQKRQALAGAVFPVDGLSFDDAGVLLNGIPFDQASSAEQLRVSVAMGLAANPELRVLLIRDGSLLDTDNLRLVAEMASAADAQVWVERVSEDGEGVSVMIEDGEVVTA